MSSTTTHTPITKEAFEHIPDAFKRFEVDRGELVEVEPADGLKTLVASVGDSLTKTEFERLHDADRYELAGGRLVEEDRVGNYESLIATRLTLVMAQCLGPRARDEIFQSDARFRLSRNPDLIRGCDVSYVPKDRMPGGRPESGVGDYVPALAVEIASPSNTAVGMAERVREWFAAGVSLLWVIYPASKCVYVYRSIQDCTILWSGQTLDGDNVLPGLRIAIDDLLA